MKTMTIKIKKYDKKRLLHGIFYEKNRWFCRPSHHNQDI